VQWRFWHSKSGWGYFGANINVRSRLGMCVRSSFIIYKQTNVYLALAAFNKGWITQTYNIAQRMHNTIEWYWNYCQWFSPYTMREFFITISSRIDGWILFSTTQSSRKLNITLGWQEIPEDIRVVSDDPLEKNILLRSSRRSASVGMLFVRRTSSYGMLPKMTWSAL